LLKVCLAITQFTIQVDADLKTQVLTILCNDAHILHRDISPNNVMLVRNDDGKVCNVLLIDFDYAATLNTNNKPANHKISENIVDRFRTVGSYPLLFFSR
jgi:serine/threonine protein kinase